MSRSPSLSPSSLSTSHVTIIILDVSLSLVHIPRSRIAELNRPILKQLLRKSPKFLNLTANEIELSIFAEDDDLADFELIARRDRQKQRFKERADSKSSLSAPAGHRRRRLSQLYDDPHPVEISFEKWRVLQIDSHEDSLYNSGSRVRELSSPLAAAGIPILYQSSYLSDFIFVKASRLAEVMKLLEAAGFSLYNTDPLDIASSPLVAVPESFSNQGFVQLQDEATGCGASQTRSPGTMTPAILSRTRSPSMASLTALSYAMSRLGTYEDLTTFEGLTMYNSRMSNSTISSSTTSPAFRRPKNSLSPTAAPVEVLEPDIACVGLNESAADVWTLKILTLVGYPELIPMPSLVSSSSPSHLRISNRRDSLADSLNGSIASLPRVRHASPESAQLSPSAELDSKLELHASPKDFFPHAISSNHCPSDPPSQDSSSPDSLSCCSGSEDEDEYFSSSSPYNRTQDHSGSTPSLVSTTSKSSARSLPEQLDLLRKSERPTLSHLTTSATLTDSQRPLSASHSPTEREPAMQTQAWSTSRIADAAPLRVPFFSFTRTAEGSSLTTDLCVLAALFGHDERHMVICSGSLLDAGDALNDRSADEKQYVVRGSQQIFDRESENLFEIEEEVSVLGTMKCLQIDLQKFGLDKHGLVNRFSRVLEDNGINHMYSSTYKTANLLVDKENAVRAQSLLRSC